jgi:uncharacterized Zn-binding protein involved in type VI secretion
MPPLARQGDQHNCPLAEPGFKLHFVVVITGPCASTVFVDNLPLALVGDSVGCQNAAPARIETGSPTLYVESTALVPVGDTTDHGGVIFTGSPTVSIDD